VRVKWGISFKSKKVSIIFKLSRFLRRKWYALPFRQGSDKSLLISAAAGRIMFEHEIIAALQKSVKGEVRLEVPPDAKLGDFAFPCFSLAKELKKAPQVIAQDLAKSMHRPEIVREITAEGPYVNFFLDTTKVAKRVVERVFAQRKEFGASEKGKGRLAAIEFSSPNIGKPMHTGHLPSTLIGHSLGRLHEFHGYRVVRLNYLGDWGTQFGKLIHAYLTWGEKEKLEKEPVKYLVELYVKVTEESKKDLAHAEAARGWFAKLEKGDQMATGLWSKFKHYSVDEFRKMYAMLGIEFDSYNGEAYYAPKVESAIELLQKKGFAQLHDGALIVRIDGFDVPMMLKKSNGSTTYASRDVATLLDRIETIPFDVLLYCVGHEQSMHFQQLFSLMRKLGHGKNFVHVANGLYLLEGGGKMSTREGRTVFVEEVLNEAIALAKKTIEEKNPQLKRKDEVALQVAVGAIFFGGLLNDRAKDTVFDLNRFLSFEGDTGPYLMYTHARASSIITRAREFGLEPKASADFFVLKHPAEERVVKLMARFGQKTLDALNEYKPHVLAQYLIEFGRAFNEFYHACPCLSEPNEDVKRARLALIEASRQVLENGLRLLGITAPFEM